MTCNSDVETSHDSNSQTVESDTMAVHGNVHALPSSVIAFEIPGPPQGKGRGRIVKRGGHLGIASAPKTVAYESLVTYAAHAAMRGRAPMTCAVDMVLLIDCPIPKSMPKRDRAKALSGELRPIVKPDGDNVEKAVCDGCNGVVYRDDAQITDVLKRKRYAQTPGLRVVFRPAGEA